MELAVIISSSLGWPLLHDLVAQQAVLNVAVPVAAPADETDLLAAQVAALGMTVIRLERTGLAAALEAWLRPLAPTAVLVLTFPWRIPASVLNLPPLGFLNVHFAALPGYRGPEPLFWQLRNGEAAGAVTLHRMEADFDTGPVLLAEAVPIGPHDTHGLHRAHLATRAVAVGRHLVAALRGQAPPLTPILQGPGRYWPRPALADVSVRWQEPAAAVHRLVRASNPWNRGAVATLRGQPLRLLSVTPLSATVSAPPGTVVRAGAEELLVACGAGEVLRLDMVALEEGYFIGSQLALLGVQAGEMLGELDWRAAERPVALTTND